MKTRHSYIRQLSEVKEDYNSFMGYVTGKPRKWWYGIKNVYAIFNGAWADPEVGYKGYAINESLLTDSLWDVYNEQVSAPDYTDQIAYKEYENGFVDWIRRNAEMVYADLDAIIESYTSNAA